MVPIGFGSLIRYYNAKLGNAFDVINQPCHPSRVHCHVIDEQDRSSHHDTRSRKKAYKCVLSSIKRSHETTLMIMHLRLNVKDHEMANGTKKGTNLSCNENIHFYVFINEQPSATCHCLPARWFSFTHCCCSQVLWGQEFWSEDWFIVPISTVRQKRFTKEGWDLQNQSSC